MPFRLFTLLVPRIAWPPSLCRRRFAHFPPARGCSGTNARFCDPSLEHLGRLPAPLAVDFDGIDGVASVMAGAVGHIRDLLGVSLAIDAGVQLVEHRTHVVDDSMLGFSFQPPGHPARGGWH